MTKHVCDQCQCSTGSWLWMKGHDWYCEACYVQLGGSVLIETEKEESTDNE